MPTAALRPIYLKDPDSICDFPVSWADWLSVGDTINTVTWGLPTELTEPAFPGKSHTDTVATIFLQGGAAGAYYEVVCTIVTVGLRTETQTIIIKCEDR